MAGRDQYLEFLIEWLAPLGEISARGMFGGHCLYCDGVVFSLVAKGTLYLKTDAVTRPQFVQLGLEPFRPFEDRPEGMHYYAPPAEFFDTQDAMEQWGRAAVEVGRRAKAKKK